MDELLKVVPFTFGTQHRAFNTLPQREMTITGTFLHNLVAFCSGTLSSTVEHVRKCTRYFLVKSPSASSTVCISLSIISLELHTGI